MTPGWREARDNTPHPWAVAFEKAKAAGLTDEQAGDQADKRFHERLQERGRRHRGEDE